MSFMLRYTISIKRKRGFRKGKHKVHEYACSLGMAIDAVASRLAKNEQATRIDYSEPGKPLKVRILDGKKVIAVIKPL